MVNLVKTNKNGFVRFSDYISQLPPYMREEEDVVSLVQVMSDYINNAYRNTSSISNHSIGYVSTENTINGDKKNLEDLRKIFLDSLNTDTPLLYISDSDENVINPFNIKRSIKLKSDADTKRLYTADPSISLDGLSIGDFIYGDSIPSDTYITSVGINYIDISNFANDSIVSYFDIVPYTGTYNDVIQFRVYSVGDIISSRVKTDLDSGVIYTRQYFNFSIYDLKSELPDIDFRYDQTGYSETEEDARNFCIQASDVKLRNPIQSPNNITASVSHGSYTISTEKATLRSIKAGQVVSYNGMLDRTYITEVSGNILTLSSAYPLTTVGDNDIPIDIYENEIITPNDNTLYILPPSGVGKNIGTNLISDSKCDSFANLPITISNGKILQFTSPIATIDSINNTIEVSNIDLTPYYSTGDIIELVIFDINKNYSRYKYTISNISYTTKTLIEVVENLNINTTGQIIINFKISDYIFYGDIIKIGNISYTIDIIKEYDVNGVEIGYQDKNQIIYRTDIIVEEYVWESFTFSTDDVNTTSDYIQLISVDGNTIIDKVIPVGSIVEFEGSNLPSGISTNTRYAVISNSFGKLKFVNNTTLVDITTTGNGQIKIISTRTSADLYTVYLNSSNTGLYNGYISSLNITSSCDKLLRLYDDRNNKTLIQTISIPDNSGSIMRYMFNGMSFEYKKNLEITYNHILPIANKTLQIANDFAILGDLITIDVDIPKYQLIDSVITDQYTITYTNSDSDTLYSETYSDKRLYRRISFIYNGTKWVFNKSIDTLNSGLGVFYLRDNSGKNLDSVNRFSDLYIEIDPEKWRGLHISGSEYKEGNYVGITNGDIYKCIADVKLSITPTNDKLHWERKDRNVYLNISSVDNPYTSVTIDSKSIKTEDVLKSSYAFSVKTNDTIEITGDVTTILVNGSSYVLGYNINGDYTEVFYTVLQSIYNPNSNITTVSVENSNFSDVEFTFITTDVDTTDDYILISNNDNIEYGQTVTFSGASLPSPLLADTDYYVRGSDIDISTNKLKLNLSTEYKSLTKIDLTTTGSGTASISSKIPDEVSSGYLIIQDINSYTYISNETKDIITIYDDQFNWISNPRFALTSESERTGWLSTTNPNFKKDTITFYCNRNLVYPFESYAIYTKLNGDVRYGYYKYTIEKLKTFNTTDYSINGVGDKFTVNYIDGLIFNKITRYMDMDLRITDNVDSSNSIIKYGIGDNTYTSRILTISDSEIELGCQLTDTDIISGGLVINYDMAIGEQIIFTGTLPPELSLSTVYYVVRSDGTSIWLSGSLGGSEITITSVGGETFTLNKNIDNISYGTFTSVKNSDVIELNVGFDFTSLSTGDYIFTRYNGQSIFPENTRIKTVFPSSNKIQLTKTATQSVSVGGIATIQIISDNVGTLYKKDKTYAKITKLNIHLDNTDDPDPIIYDELDINSPSDIYRLPADALTIMQLPNSDDENELDSFDFRNLYIDNIDTSLSAQPQYNYKKDYNTSVLNKNSRGEYIINTNTKPDFVGVSDKDYPLVEKIERLIYQKDANVIDMKFIDVLARFMGYDITLLKEDVNNSDKYLTQDERDKFIRKVVQNIPEYNRIQSTENGLEALIATFGMVGRFIKLWTFQENPYLSVWLDDISVNSYMRANIGNGKPLVSTPHFKLRVDINENESALVSDLSRIRISINRNKPINTVFDGIITYLNTTITQHISSPSMKNKMRTSISIGYDMSETPDTEYFDDCGCLLTL